MNSRPLIFGVILIAVGLLLVLQTIGGIDFGDMMSVILPLGLIALGIWLILRRRGKDASNNASATFESGPKASTIHVNIETGQHHSQAHFTQASATAQMGPEGKLRYTKMFGDQYIDFNNTRIQNIEVSSFIGDVELRLHGAELADGLNRMVVSGFIGDLRVHVPAGMAIYVQASTFIGDIDLMGRRATGFGNTVEAQTPDYQSAQAKLFVAANHFIGDVRFYVV